MVAEPLKLEDYAVLAHLANAVQDVRQSAAVVVPRLKWRTLWMLNSTATGGGVAEMLPKLVALLNELGVSTRWAVIRSDRPEFFGLTKRLHNLIHGHGEPRLTDDDRALYESVNRESARELLEQRRDPWPEHHRRRIELLRLVLAGPEAGAVADDPEAAGVLDELRRR